MDQKPGRLVKVQTPGPGTRSHQSDAQGVVPGDLHLHHLPHDSFVGGSGLFCAIPCCLGHLPSGFLHQMTLPLAFPLLGLTLASPQACPARPQLWGWT